jgi:hypothetical protein
VDESAERFPRESGTAGASARREYERRRENRERRAHERHPHIGRLLLALQQAPKHEVAWERGAAGEEQIGRRLAELCGERVILLHDRCIPGSRANIDHIAIAPTGVWVIDTKRYRGKVVVEKPLLRQPKLKIGGRDRSGLVDGLARQVEAVRAAVLEIDPGVPVHGALCFVEADLPLLGTLRFAGYPLLYVRALAKRLNAPGEVSAVRLRTVAQAVAVHFSSAR